MTLSELVQTRADLFKINPSALKDEVAKLKERANIYTVFISQDPVLNSNRIIEAIDTINENIKNIESVIDSLSVALDKTIDVVSEPYHHSGSLVNGSPIGFRATVDVERTVRTYPVDSESVYSVVSRIALRTTNHFPALEIGPGDGFYTKHMVAGDPLYLVDVHQEFLDSTVQQFPIEYQRRIRPYLIGSHGIGDTNLSIIPQGQMGFVLVCGVFEYYTQDIIAKYLQSIKDVMRPGGYCLLTYNNTEDPHAARLAEKAFKSWMPKRKLAQICESLGFMVTDSYDKAGQLHWIEIQKPGVLETVKRGQALGEIIARTS